MDLFYLFVCFMKIGALSFGGGYASMALIEEEAVVKHGWITMNQFADIMGIAEMTPGPITLNGATFVGIQVAGIPGALAATAGCILPSFLIVSVLAFFYYRYRGLSLIQGVLKSLRPAVAAMIAGACVKLMKVAFFGKSEGFGLSDLKWIPVIIFLLCFFMIRKWKPGPIKIIIFSGILGVILQALMFI